MGKTKYHLLVLFIVLIFGLSLIISCIPDLADIDPPVVTIVNPSAETSVNGTVPIVVSATDDDKIKEIRIFVDGIIMATTGESFITYSWDTTPYADNLEHFISAIAIDESDNIGSSEIVNVTVIRGQNQDNIAPEVEILNPVEGQIVMGDVNIVAEASDNNQVEKVEFYIDGLLVDTVLNQPFDYLWKTTRNDTGEHTIFARAYDTNANTAASLTISVTVDTTLDNTPPSVAIINPIDGQTVSGTVNIVANATDNNQVSKVEFYIDGFLEATATTSPYNYLWNTSQVELGLHSIFAIAYDPNNNNTVSQNITVTVDTAGINIPPVVIITNPLNGQVVSGIVNIAAEATDDEGIEKVEFYIDGFLEQTVFTSPYNYLWDTDQVNAGDHNIYARAVDIRNNSATSPAITVTVDTTIDIISPVVNITNPINGQTVSGTVNIVADATDNNEVERVEFYIDGLLEQTVFSTPYDYPWDTDQVNVGNHNIYAKAYDLSNNSAISPAISVTVDTLIDNIPPVVNIINPPNGQIVSGMVNIFAEATDNIQVDRVEFFIDGFLESTATSPPFDYLWNTALVDSGIHNIFARAFDLSNNSAVSPTITVTVTHALGFGNILPKVKIINPTKNGLILSATETISVPIEVEVLKNIGIQKIEFYIDGDLQKVVSDGINNHFKYDWNLENFSDGLLHTIFVKAYNNSLNTSADMKVIRVYP